MLRNPRNTLWMYKHQIPRQLEQSFKKFFILDFEATCEKGGTLQPMEIIEFPCLVVNSEDFQIHSQFHRFVKPRVHPWLTPFCTQLTGISQELVKKEQEFPEVFSDFTVWLEKNFDDVGPDGAIFVTCGNWDLGKMLPSQCEMCNIDVPPQMRRWINIKTSFFQATGHYPRSLKDMFKHLNKKMIGQQHSGLDDSKNIIRIMSHLASKRYIFEETDGLDDIRSKIEESSVQKFEIFP